MDDIIIGVDEAGRGPLFGDVYTSAVVLSRDGINRDMLKDSKKYTSKKKINEVYHCIINSSSEYSIDFLTHEDVDKYNILQATQKSMHTSIRNVIDKIILSLKNDGTSSIEEVFNIITILVDGNYFKPFTYLYLEDLYPIKHICVIKGDQLHKEISAASVLAKVSRDKYITSFVEQHPEYEEKYKLSKNKGYGTKEHRDGIKKYGYSEFHRKSFKLKELPTIAQFI
jgi:ribonuclease HII|tara:strand:+ start:213 stop:890 length:678 start_codon:yes stop_codon:yes gene_type:complete